MTMSNLSHSGRRLVHPIGERVVHTVWTYHCHLHYTKETLSIILFNLSLPTFVICIMRRTIIASIILLLWMVFNL